VWTPQEYLLAGSDAGSRPAAALYSLIESAKLNGLNPQLYIADMLAALPTIPPAALANSCPGTGNRSTPLALPPEPARSPNAYAQSRDEVRPLDSLQSNPLAPTTTSSQIAKIQHIGISDFYHW
jgi:IS66 C-terminal element